MSGKIKRLGFSNGTNVISECVGVHDIEKRFPRNDKIFHEFTQI